MSQPIKDIVPRRRVSLWAGPEAILENPHVSPPARFDHCVAYYDYLYEENLHILRNYCDLAQHSFWSCPCYQDVQRFLITTHGDGDVHGFLQRQAQVWYEERQSLRASGIYETPAKADEEAHKQYTTRLEEEVARVYPPILEKQGCISKATLTA